MTETKTEYWVVSEPTAIPATTPPTPPLAEQILLAMNEQVAAYNALCKAQRRTLKAQIAEDVAQRDAKIADARMAALAMQYQAAHVDDGTIPF